MNFLYHVSTEFTFITLNSAVPFITSSFPGSPSVDPRVQVTPQLFLKYDGIFRHSEINELVLNQSYVYVHSGL